MFGKGKSCGVTVAVLAGLLFSIGWWLFVDSLVQSTHEKCGSGKVYEYIPGILTTAGMFLLLNLPDQMFDHDTSIFADSSCGLSAVLILSIVLLIGGPVEAIWQRAALSRYKDPSPRCIQNIGNLTIAQSILIAIGAVAWRFFAPTDAEE